MSSNRSYFYTLKDDKEIYLAQYLCDDTARDELLSVFGGQLVTIWRPEQTVYGDR